MSPELNLLVDAQHFSPALHVLEEIALSLPEEIATDICDIFLSSFDSLHAELAEPIFRPAAGALHHGLVVSISGIDELLASALVAHQGQVVSHFATLLSGYDGQSFSVGLTEVPSTSFSGGGANA